MMKTIKYLMVIGALALIAGNSAWGAHDARYQWHDGYYGMNKEIDFKSQIQTLRTDDYARTFQKFSYVFNSDVSAQKIWLFKLGRTHRYTAPELVYGNVDGLIEQHDVHGIFNTLQ